MPIESQLNGSDELTGLLSKSNARDFGLDNEFPFFDQIMKAVEEKDIKEFEKKIADLSSLDPNVVRFRRLYVSAAIECEMDKNGRVLIPPHLRDKASLEREVLLAGMGRWAELWSKAQWDESLAMTNDERELFKKSVTETIRI